MAAALPDCEVVPMAMSPARGPHALQRPRLSAYYDAYAALAESRGLELIDLRQAWQEALTGPAQERRYLRAGLHPGRLAAREIVLPGVLAGLGF